MGKSVLFIGERVKKGIKKTEKTRDNPRRKSLKYSGMPGRKSERKSAKQETKKKESPLSIRIESSTSLLLPDAMNL